MLLLSLPTAYRLFTLQEPSKHPAVARYASAHQPKNVPKEIPKWASFATPLSVALQAKGLPIQLLQKALSAWEKGSDQQVHFTLLEKPTVAAVQSADILILWAETLLSSSQQEASEGCVSGKAWLHVKAVKGSPVIVGSTIELAQTPTIDAYLSKQAQQDRLYSTLIHELGHALGLKHAQQANSVMHATGWKNTQLTLEDRGLFHQLYGSRPNHQLTN